MTETHHQERTHWIGRTESAADQISTWRAVVLAGALDLDDPPREGGVLPTAWHWLYFLPTFKASELGHDGHAKLGPNLRNTETAVDTPVFESQLKFGGSISAEHGIGSLTVDHSPGYKPAVALDRVRSIQCAPDPRDLMNCRAGFAAAGAAP